MKNLELVVSEVQHDFLHFKHLYPLQVADDGSVDKHSLAIIRDAFQAILDDSNEMESLLAWYRDHDDAKMGLHIKCAIHDATERYVHTHINELEQESSVPTQHAA